MRLKTELGRRVQLQSMDPHCHDITIGLYEYTDENGAPLYVIHSYNARSGVADRLAFLAKAMARVGGMETIAGSPGQVRWPCGDRHLAATKRLFVEVCKLSKPEDLVERPPTMQDA